MFIIILNRMIDNYLEGVVTFFWKQFWKKKIKNESDTPNSVGCSMFEVECIQWSDGGMTGRQEFNNITDNITQ